MGTKRSTPAPPPPVQGVDHHALRAALTLFVSRFVIPAKRDQMLARLLTAERRRETLEALPRWLAGRQAPLEGVDQSPTGLGARFGELTGILLDPARARRTTIGGTLALARGEVALFIGDAGRIALVYVGDAPPLLCMPG